MSFQHGLSGLNAAARNLDVIGNNVANAQTVRPGRSERTGETIRSGEVAVWANIGTTAVLTSISRNSTINVRR